MDKIAIPDEQVISLEEIAPGVHGLRIVFVNVFGVAQPDGRWTLIDAGPSHAASRIRSWAEKTFHRPPTAIVLTHGHFDHSGSARELAEGWNVPVFAHALELPFLDGRQAYQAPNWKAGGGAMALLSPVFDRGPFEMGERLRELPGEGSELPGMADWQFLATPGHTPGHVSLWRESDGTLLVGDAFCTTKAESFFEAAVLQQPELHGPPAYLTPDWTAAAASVRRLASLRPRTVAVGHGKPLTGPGVADELQALATRFLEVAVPDNVKGA